MKAATKRIFKDIVMIVVFVLACSTMFFWGYFQGESVGLYSCNYVPDYHYDDGQKIPVLFSYPP